MVYKLLYSPPRTLICIRSQLKLIALLPPRILSTKIRPQTQQWVRNPIAVILKPATAPAQGSSASFSISQLALFCLFPAKIGSIRENKIGSFLFRSSQLYWICRKIFIGGLAKDTTYGKCFFFFFKKDYCFLVLSISSAN